MALSILTDDDFQYLGSWKTVDCKPHRAPWIKYQPGLYAFVVDEEVVYVGKASPLHRRIRNYSRRAFRDKVREKRQAHASMSDGTALAMEIKLYVKLMPDSDDASRKRAEDDLIMRLRPRWNRTHGLKPKAI